MCLKIRQATCTFYQNRISLTKWLQMDYLISEKSATFYWSRFWLVSRSSGRVFLVISLYLTIIKKAIDTLIAKSRSSGRDFFHLYRTQPTSMSYIVHFFTKSEVKLCS